MMTVFFNSEGVVRHEFPPQGKTVTKEYYLEVMKHLCEAIRKKEAQCLEVKPMIHADNAPTHTSLLIRQLLVKYETTVIPQPPYLPELAPVDCFIPKLKTSFIGRRSELTDSIKENSPANLHSILNEAFQNVSKAGRNVESDVFKVEGNTLKATRPNSFSGRRKSFIKKF
jgi:histone-lysine N-methyltransferase SETMAR